MVKVSRKSTKSRRVTPLRKRGGSSNKFQGGGVAGAASSVINNKNKNQPSTVSNNKNKNQPSTVSETKNVVKKNVTKKGVTKPVSYISKEVVKKGAPKIVSRIGSKFIPGVGWISMGADLLNLAFKEKSKAYQEMDEKSPGTSKHLETGAYGNQTSDSGHKVRGTFFSAMKKRGGLIKRKYKDGGIIDEGLPADEMRMHRKFSDKMANKKAKSGDYTPQTVRRRLVSPLKPQTVVDKEKTQKEKNRKLWEKEHMRPVKMQDGGTTNEPDWSKMNISATSKNPGVDYKKSMEEHDQSEAGQRMRANIEAQQKKYKEDRSLGTRTQRAMKPLKMLGYIPTPLTMGIGAAASTVDASIDVGRGKDATGKIVETAASVIPGLKHAKKFKDVGKHLIKKGGTKLATSQLKRGGLIMKKHRKKHSAKHIKVMKEEMAKGKSFDKAHVIAIKRVGK